MVPGGIKSEQLVVGGVGDPGHRMPIAGRHRRQRPSRGLESQTLMNVRVLNDVIPIVVVDEVVSSDRGVNRSRGGGNERGQDPKACSGSSTVRDSRA